MTSTIHSSKRMSVVTFTSRCQKRLYHYSTGSCSRIGLCLLRPTTNGYRITLSSTTAETTTTTTTGKGWRKSCYQKPIHSINDDPCYISISAGKVRKRPTAFRAFHTSTCVSSRNNSRNDKKTTNDAITDEYGRQTMFEMDFFQEPVTFAGVSLNSDEHNESLVGNSSSGREQQQKQVVTNAMAAFDGFLLAVVSKGLSCTDGGNEGGLNIKSAHSVAVSWSEILRFASVWNQPQLNKKEKGNTNDNNTTTSTTSEEYNNNNKSAPMLAVVAVAPILVQAGVPYMKHIDTLLKYTKPAAPGLPIIQMYEIAVTAASCKNDKHLNPRERQHLLALHYLLIGENQTALVTYLRLLRSCPGDALALSLSMDLCQSLGDKEAATRIASTVASYWSERAGGILTPSLPGFPMASALIALGYAVGGVTDVAERMAIAAMSRGRKVNGALATWAQCQIFDSRGRVSEGISALANFDGVRNYEGSGLLFFDCRLSGYGARFALDREERGRGKSAAIRLYEDNFDRVLGYSGYSTGQPWTQPLQRAPLSWAEPGGLLTGSEESSTNVSFWDKLFGGKKQKKEKKPTYDLLVKQVNFPSTMVDQWDPTAEDVLTWLPPTPQLLSDATLLCLRFTLNGTISARNARWDDIRNAWMVILDLNKKHGNNNPKYLTASPLICVVSSLLLPPNETGGDRIGTGRLAEGLHKMGELLHLGNPVTEEQSQKAVREIVAERSPTFWLPSNETERNAWTKVVEDIVSAVDGVYDYKNTGSSSSTDTTASSTSTTANEFERADPSLRFQSWDFEARPILEHAVVYAACKSGDLDSLLYARAICSHGVTVRTNSPEEWWRYSIVLGLLGDVTGSEDALNNSINFGGGQGARGTMTNFYPKNWK